MEMTQISIDLDVYKEIQSRITSFNDTPNQVLRRVFFPTETVAVEAKGQGINMHVRGTVLKDGLKLRKIYKGEFLEAVVDNGKILFNGKRYNSPSKAGCDATGTSVNGWIFWEYLDENSGSWRLLDNLRK